VRRSGDTVHIDVIDRRGQHGRGDAVGRLAAVLAHACRASASAEQPGADVLAEEGLPTSLAPGKRPRTTLTPSLA
jgi:gamma-glutamyltranspeptidase / glutathione hydrolase